MAKKQSSKKVVQVSPIKFNAGGKSPKQHKKDDEVLSDTQEEVNNKLQEISPRKTPAAVSGGVTIPENNPDNRIDTSNMNNMSNIDNSTLQWIQAGIHKKKSILSIQNWIATVLTLDGRDKFTKILQYSSRMLCWYFAGLALSTSTATTRGGVGGIGNIESGTRQQELYQAISIRFNSLYKSIVSSRKAFRMGRSIIEYDKIKSMGWGDYLGYWLAHPLAESGVMSGCNDDGCDERENGYHAHSLARYDTHPIPEEDEEEEGHSDNDNDDDGSWSGDEKEEEVPSVEEKKDENDDAASSKKSKKKTISRPGRPILPSRISSNIGWGPSNTTTAAAASANDGVSSKNTEANHHPPPRTVSEMGRGMYRPYPSQSSTSFGSYNQLKEKTTALSPCPPPPPTPAWKLIGGTLKLLGLMGFWAFDNFSFLTTSGFLDPIHLGNGTSTSNDNNNSSATKSNSVTSVRTRRKKWASENAARCYFMGGLAGLYVNLRSFWIHRNGALAEARRKYHDGSSDDSSNDDNGDAQAQAQQQQRRNALKKIEQKHFELFLALVKSVCDVTVFSNNPGIDLHLKLRGKKNHEGLHCLCGLISASTVLYNNFPNASE